MGEKQSVETHCVWSLLPSPDQPRVNRAELPAGARGMQPEGDTEFRGFVVNVYNLFSDDLSQTSHQAFCNFLSVVELHKRRFPWQTRCIRQTDGAGTYNSFKIALHSAELKRLTGVHLAIMMHPEPEHGGEQCDKV